jgi:hypothetical protein
MKNETEQSNNKRLDLNFFKVDAESSSYTKYISKSLLFLSNRNFKINIFSIFFSVFCLFVLYSSFGYIGQHLNKKNIQKQATYDLIYVESDKIVKDPSFNEVFIKAENYVNATYNEFQNLQNSLEIEIRRTESLSSELIDVKQSLAQLKSRFNETSFQYHSMKHKGSPSINEKDMIRFYNLKNENYIHPAAFPQMNILTKLQNLRAEKEKLSISLKAKSSTSPPTEK